MSTTTDPTLFGTRSSSSSAEESSHTDRNADAPSPQIETQDPLFVCEPASYNFTGGTPPYQDLYIIKSGQSDAEILHTLPEDEQPGIGSWGVDIEPGTSITFVIRDSLNKYGYSDAVVVQDGHDHSCLPPEKLEAKKSKILGGVLGAVGGLLIIATLIWFFIIRRGQIRKKPPPKLTYEEGEGDLAEAVERSAPHSLRHNPDLLAKSGADFNLEGVVPIRNQGDSETEKPPLPAYPPDARHSA